MKKDVDNPRDVSYKELKGHSSYSDAWISINGIVYDITQFIHRHPFGDAFRGNLGTECGGLFSSSHLNVNVEKLLHNDKYLQENNILKIGRLTGYKDLMRKDNDDPFLDRIIYTETDRDEFWQELKSEVRDYIKKKKETTHYSFAGGMLFIIYYTLIYLILSYLAWVKGSFIASAALGFHLLCTVTNISHLATHFGFTKHRVTNFIAKYFFDVSGMSWLEWQIAHQTHHNQPHSSIDYQTNAYNHIGIRIHGYEKHRNYHRYQPYYFWVVISFYHVFRLFVTSFWLVRNKEFARHRYEFSVHLFLRLVFAAQVACCAYLHGLGMASIVFALYSMAYSYSAFILLYNDHEDAHHELGNQENVKGFHSKISWAKTQVVTSNNWYPTNWVLRFIEFHYGYFNYHIEHHLFPAFKPSLCKKLSPIVKRVCDKHKVPYVSTTFLEVQRSLQRHITKLSLG